jgi:nucleotide-binding universal stress UspA family protein
MALLSKILVPVEFSPRCHGSAQYAEALAARFHCNLTLLHVVIPPSPSCAGPDVAAYASIVDLESGILEEAQARLDAFPITAPGCDSPVRALLEGDPASAIVEYARDGAFDLIVMPTHAYGPFRRFLLGSVTAQVLRQAHCPVWTGPHMESAPAFDSLSFHNILCALDAQGGSRAVLDWASAFARQFDAQLHIETGEDPLTIWHAAQRLHADLLVIGRAHAYAVLRESPCPTVAV